ncbi:hypothetical protein N7U66_12625 [Lacinutrix neustonica]|uniref:Uncharacterized protein n=1 Tax=Lacinutrix neustonica TaxID=2980107 RepID=A0A9E8MVE7_9FLAO|nr:hypothetical protein [Lacinutrix neustonica]WAC01020.1 hypothetical protein N7U66_12625 [Lacinutrix neustonica]
MKSKKGKVSFFAKLSITELNNQQSLSIIGGTVTAAEVGQNSTNCHIEIRTTTIATNQSN